MDEPVTWTSVLWLDALYGVGVIVTAAGLYIADKYETWKKSRPDWKNDWE